MIRPVEHDATQSHTTPPAQAPRLAMITSRRRLLAKVADPLPPHGDVVRRWRAQQVRQALRVDGYDEQTALDGALERLAADLGISLKD